jgi:uncharacterized protein YecT (DUF1311 family)
MIAAFLLLAAAPAEPEESCASPQTQLAMNMCAQGDFERADAAMNVQWRRTVAAAKAADRSIDRTYDRQPGYHQTLLAAQRAWLTYRDQHCLGESFAARGGSMAPMLVSGCKASLTEARTRQLKELAEVEN